MPAGEPTVDTVVAARETSTATSHHRRSAPRNSDKNRAANHECVHPRKAKRQRATARFRNRFCAPRCCRRRGRQLGKTVPAAARLDTEERHRDVPVPVSILPGKCQQHCGCGKRFRVAGGRVTGRIHPHACPTCGTIVYDARAPGKTGHCGHRGTNNHANLPALPASTFRASSCTWLSSGTDAVKGPCRRD